VAGVDELRAQLTMRRLAATAILAAACGGGDAGRQAVAPAAAPAPPSVEVMVDSMLRDFRRGLAEPAALDGGAKSRDGLVATYLDALVRRDTAALAGLTLTRAEFAYLFFPTTRLARPPYGMDPALLWMQLRANGEGDVRRALSYIRKQPQAYAGHHCPSEPAVEGRNRLDAGCVVVLHAARGADTVSLFGTIVERDGRFKFLSYANRL
jgi:hypothetical protein